MTHALVTRSNHKTTSPRTATTNQSEAAMAATKENDTDATGGSQTSPASPRKLCPELKAFYVRYNITGIEELLDDDAPHSRFVRLNPRHDKAETLRLLKVSSLHYFYYGISRISLFVLPCR